VTHAVSPVGHLVMQSAMKTQASLRPQAEISLQQLLRPQTVQLLSPGWEAQTDAGAAASGLPLDPPAPDPDEPAEPVELADPVVFAALASLRPLEPPPGDEPDWKGVSPLRSAGS
jgi:hypothetical protein